MVRGGFRHLVVTTGGEVAGLLSMRDIVRCWTDDGAICDVPAQRAVRRGCVAVRRTAPAALRGRA